MAGAIEDDAATLELAKAMDHEFETVNLDPSWSALQARYPTITLHGAHTLH